MFKIKHCLFIIFSAYLSLLIISCTYEDNPIISVSNTQGVSTPPISPTPTSTPEDRDTTLPEYKGGTTIGRLKVQVTPKYTE